MTIENDTLDNYIIIRRKLFRINNGIPHLNHPRQLAEWKKSTFYMDYPKSDYDKIKVIKNPRNLPQDIKDLYMSYLEMKLFKPHQLVVEE